jgi:cytochrome c553
VVRPSQYFNKFSDQDLGDIVAYLKSLPPMDNDLAKTKLKFLGRIITVLDSEILPASMIGHEAPRPASPAKGVTKEYGEYLVTVCTACHWEHLSGSALPGEGGDAPAAGNLTHLAASDWSEADSGKAVRTGVTPFRKLDQEFMPWETLANLTDDEVTALWLYINSLEPREYEK